MWNLTGVFPNMITTLVAGKQGISITDTYSTLGASSKTKEWLLSLVKALGLLSFLCAVCRFWEMFYDQFLWNKTLSNTEFY